MRRNILSTLLLPLPALLAMLLLLLSAAPVDAAWMSYTPNIVWLMTLVMVAQHPASWPYGVVFALGLVQDMLCGTPLGLQTLIALLLAKTVPHAPPFSRFPARLVAVFFALLLCHVALWAGMHLLAAGAPAFWHMLIATLVNNVWFILFYYGAACCFMRDAGEVGP